MTRALDAAAIVGLLADHDRRAVFAAVQLGHGTIESISTLAEISSPKAAKAAGRLAEAGLIVQREGALVINDDAVQSAARDALSKPATTEHADRPNDVRKVLEAFVVDGRIMAVPSTHSKRLVVLDWLSQDFEPGRRYTEAMVNLIIGRRHADTAAWRRYLVDADMLSREAGEYWRSGGTMP